MARTSRTPRATSKTNGNSTSDTKKPVSSFGNGDSAAHQALLEEQIRVRAYELFEQRGKTHGHAHEDWLRAEAEVRGRVAGRA